MEYHTEKEEDVADLLTWAEGKITYTVKFDAYPAERYSWGGSRGTETVAEARIMSVQIGDLILDRNQAILAFGEEAVKWHENNASEQACEAEAA